MEPGRLVDLVSFPGWLVGITYLRCQGYRCWVINPSGVVLNDGEVYPTHASAISAGRGLVEQSLELD